MSAARNVRRYLNLPSLERAWQWALRVRLRSLIPRATAHQVSSRFCYVKAIFIHVSRLAQSIEVTAYTSSGYQVEQFIRSGEVTKTSAPQGR